MKIRPVGAELFHATDGQTVRRTDMMKQMVAVRGFANVPKMFPILKLIEALYILRGARGGGTALQVGRSRVRSPMM